jgi:hypothetical protein
MTVSNSLDLKGFITNAISDVFDTMLSMEVESVTMDQPESFNGTYIVGAISFAGVVMGNLNMRAGDEFARRITSESGKDNGRSPCRTWLIMTMGRISKENSAYYLFPNTAGERCKVA